jgi:hypothetical protein
VFDLSVNSTNVSVLSLFLALKFRQTQGQLVAGKVLGLCLRAGNRSTKAALLLKLNQRTAVGFCTSACLKQTHF